MTLIFGNGVVLTNMWGFWKILRRILHGKKLFAESTDLFGGGHLQNQRTGVLTEKYISGSVALRHRKATRTLSQRKKLLGRLLTCLLPCFFVSHFIDELVP